MKPYRLLETSRKYTEYDMIQKHTGVPEFPDTRVHLLHAFLNMTDHNESVSHRGELFPLVAGIVQMAMDTHDMIDTLAVHQEEEAMRSRQLNVLAGDFFSSRFYELLAKAGEIEMISLLSAAICETNRLKMNLYHNVQSKHFTAEQYVQSLIQLKMELFILFTPYISTEVSSLWQALLTDFSRAEILANELTRLHGEQGPFGSYALYQVLEHVQAQSKDHLVSDHVTVQQWNEWDQTYQITVHLRSELSSVLADITQRLEQAGHAELQTEVLQLTDSYQALVLNTEQ